MAWTDEVIRKGDKGELVANVQQGLLYLGYDCGDADGIYGGNTLGAIQDFQRKNGLKVDGICGPITGKKLEEVYWAKQNAAKAQKTAPGKMAKGAPAKGAPAKGAPAKKMPPKK